MKSEKPQRPLTRRQLQMLNFVVAQIKKTGMPPTIREIGNEMGINSTNGINDHLAALCRKGFIQHGSGRSRGITVLKLFDGSKVLRWEPVLEACE